jgi:molecular chaperone DnaK (HSP70)
MTAFGIDLGTTQSCVAMIDESGRPVVLKSAIGEDKTPSVVYFESPQNVIVGSAAKNSALLHPDRVAQLIKRKMGHDVELIYHGEKHTPETVSALILRELARAAAEQTGETVRDVVITVPANFGIAEQEATRRAGQIAGLNVLDVVAEPVAAALSYRAMGDAPGPRHILVYDLGGGTFDTTVIRVEGNDITVICTDGQDALGGADWDQVLADYLLSQFTEQCPGLDPRGDAQFMQDLVISAEQLKKDLSVAQSRRRNLRHAGAVARVEVDRAQFEELTADLLEHTVTVTERAFATARRRGVTAIDEVLLVGGMTRMPAVTRILKERLNLNARPHDPDLAVAKGAAIFAMMREVRPPLGLSASAAEKVAARTGMTVPELETMAARRVTTVIPRAFGVKTIDGRDPLAHTDPVNAKQMVVHLLQANTALPADTGPYTFHTVIENQRMIGIEVWEQAGAAESESLEENRKVGEGLLRNLPARLPVRTPLEVTFLMSETGTLSVHAVEPRSGRDVHFDLQIGGLDPAGMETARASVARYEVSG